MRIRCSFTLIGVLACSIATEPAMAGKHDCAERLSVTTTPDFNGLTSETRANDGQSTEAGTFKVFRDNKHRPRYVLAETYGETGKRVALYALLDASVDSFSARVSDYAYQTPIGTGEAKVVGVQTTSFIVCEGRLVEGVGAIAPAEVVVRAAKYEVAKAAR